MRQAIGNTHAPCHAMQQESYLTSLVQLTPHIYIRKPADSCLQLVVSRCMHAINENESCLPHHTMLTRKIWHLFVVVSLDHNMLALYHSTKGWMLGVVVNPQSLPYPVFFFLPSPTQGDKQMWEKSSAHICLVLLCLFLNASFTPVHSFHCISPFSWGMALLCLPWPFFMFVIRCIQSKVRVNRIMGTEIDKNKKRGCSKRHKSTKRRQASLSEAQWSLSPPSLLSFLIPANEMNVILFVCWHHPFNNNNPLTYLPTSPFIVVP